MQGIPGLVGPTGPAGVIGPVLAVLKPKLGLIVGKIAVTGGWLVVYDTV